MVSGPKGDPGPRGERGRKGPDGRKGDVVGNVPPSLSIVLLLSINKT